MSFVNKILGSLGGNLVEKIGVIIDQNVTSKEEKLKINLELEKAKMEFTQKAQELELNFEKEITERHRNDMTSDNWLSKNIRPLVLIFTILMFSTLTLLAGLVPDFYVDDAFTETFKSWGLIAMSFYFGARSLEKIFVKKG
jgi:hypothetical protein